MVPPCIICQIVRGEIPAWIVAQTDNIVCFLPRELNAYGHTIIAPKLHYLDLFTLPEHVAGEVMCVAKTLTLHYASAVQAAGVNLLHASGTVAGQSVLHFHLHLLPRYEGDGLDAWPHLGHIVVDKDDLLSRLRLGGTAASYEGPAANLETSETW